MIMSAFVELTKFSYSCFLSIMDLQLMTSTLSDLLTLFCFDLFDCNCFVLGVEVRVGADSSLPGVWFSILNGFVVSKESRLRVVFADMQV